MCIILDMPTPSTTYAVRLPLPVYEALQADAKAERRSVNYKIVEILASHYKIDAEPPVAGGRRVKGSKVSDLPPGDATA